MNITKATVVTMELPTGFAVADGAKLSIKHTKSNDLHHQRFQPVRYFRSGGSYREQGLSDPAGCG